MALNLSEILAETWWNNTVEDYLVTLGIFLGLFLLFKLFNHYIIYKLRKLTKKTKTEWDDLLIEFLKEIKWMFYLVVSFYISMQYLELPPFANKALYYLLLAVLGFYIAKGISKAINHFVKEQIRKKQKADDKSSGSMIKVLGVIVKVVVWAIVLLMILSNIGVEITPLIAGMGIGGIAVALALQSILGDLFAAFIIYFDKPFKEGDFIIVGADMGVVKYIGLKSTRIQALQGQELVMSNTELINSRVNNYKRMEKRRIVFSFGVKYDTGKAKLKKIKGIVGKIFESMKGADLDRVHFKQFGDFSLNYEVVYFVDTPDYNAYMDLQEDINMKLYSEFEKAGIGFAFPTQTIEMEKHRK
ncbi:mechanosensitive ion channel family protein [Candidatus Woesearchaeota archaeon]|nr:mechanosensitive ion channel family protein [Candidatus Woesearchaeota archaeon]